MQLNLDYTRVGNAGMKEISALTNMVSLNLVGTAVGDKGLSYLSSLKNLKHIFLFQTNVTVEGVSRLSSALPSVQLDTGSYQLPTLETDTLIFKGPR